MLSNAGEAGTEAKGGTLRKRKTYLELDRGIIQRLSATGFLISVCGGLLSAAELGSRS
jgi:hypothetical protein